MTPPLRFVVIAALLTGLWLSRRWMVRRDLPPPPWRVPVAAAALQLVGDPLASVLPGPARSLALQADGLTGSYAVLVLAVWGLVELPGALKWIRPMAQILRDLLTLLIAAVLTLLYLEQARVNLVGLVTTSAVLTAVIGLAAQETLKDLFGGLSMQIGATFRVGDWVDLGDHRGRVESITLMNTVLRSLEGAEIVVPNSQAASAITRRYQPGAPVGHRFTLGLDYSHPPAQASRLLSALLARHPAVLQDPPPQVWISRFADSAVEYELLLFQRDPGDGPQCRLRGELLEQLWYALHREDRRIPFPVLELRRHDGAPGEDGEGAWRQPQQRAALLATNPLFASLSAAQLATLAPLTRCVRFGPGETVVREGEAGDCLYQVVEGRVEVLRGEESIAALSPGAVFGEMTLLTDAPRNATVRSCGETVLLEVERQDLVPLLEASPALLDELGALVHQRRRELEELRETSSDEPRARLLSRMRQLFAGLGVR
ncbi:MAG: cyclic nucleotide-binding domain-containing protein [Cyanobium sp.]